MHLTGKMVRDAKPEAKVYSLRDDDPTGLSLRVWPSSKRSRDGKRVWTLDYRFAGKSKRLNIGNYEEFTLEKARNAAREYLQQVRSGVDPLEVRKSLKGRLTVNHGLDRFLNQHIPERIKKGRMAERTATEYKRQIEKYIAPKIGKKAIEDVTKGDIQRVIKGRPPVMANRLLALMSSVFTQFEHWELRPQHTNPVRGVEKAREDERDRTLTDTELSALGRALSKMDDANPYAILAIRLAAFTGLRIGEVRNMMWKHIDFENNTLILPKTKTGRRIHTMPGDAMALLENTKQVGVWVIAGSSDANPLDYKMIQKTFKRACRDAEIEDVRLHDLRRTIMTQAAASGVSAHFLRDMVGHKTTAMADRYIRRVGAPLTELRENMGAAMADKMGMSARNE